MSREFHLFLIFQYFLIITNQSSIIILEDRGAIGCKPCYRKLFAGKRLAEIHIRKSINCEEIEDCSRECDSEKGFSCEGFNYRHPGASGSHLPQSRFRNRGAICELTSMQPSEIDIIRDILHEPSYDYYERNLGCNDNKNRPSSRPPNFNPQPQSSGWLNIRPSSRPVQEDVHGPYFERPIETPRPLSPDRIRPEMEIPRPFGNDYLPKRRHQGEHGQPSRGTWRPDKNNYQDFYNRRPSPDINIDIRPIEDEIRYEYFARPDPPRNNLRPLDYRRRPKPQDLGINEIEPYRPGRRKDSINSWGSAGYGGIYGGNYGYSTNYIGNGYEPEKKWNRDRKPFDNRIGTNYGDEVYNYGGAFGYGDLNEGNSHVNDGYKRRYNECSIRSGAGFKLRRGIVRKSYLTRNLDQCENLCAIEKDCLCMTFSYRYSLAANAPTDNCLISEISYRDLDFYNDLEPDRDYDIYSMTGDQKSCEKERPVNERPPEECFWRVRSGCGVPPEVVRKTIFARGLGDCEAECVESRLFTCRSFVFRYGDIHSPDEGSPNCYLSDWPSQEIDPLSLPELEGAELYQRGSFGRGCEPFPFPPLNNRRRIPEANNNRPMKKDEICYSEYKKPCRLTPQAVMLTIYVNSEFECRERCSEMRERDPSVPCMSFSYRISNSREEHNCFMSDVPRRDLRPGIDYVHGDGYLLFAWKDFEPECDSGYSIGVLIDDDERGHGSKGPMGSMGFAQGQRPYSDSHFEPPFENEQKPIRPNGNRYPPPSSPDFGDRRPFGHGHGHVGGYGDNFRPNNDGGFNDPVRPSNPDRPDPAGPNYGEIGRPGPEPRPEAGYFGDTDGRFGHGFSDDRYNDFSYEHRGSTFEHFTVNGRPCKRGTKCERNKIAGFWSCEPEGGEFGTWDYCCEPNHHCGYSQGYHYPWCYVGPYEDQWRPCSEKYYPHLSSSRPINRPSSDRYDEDYPYGEIPRPGMLGRHWPVAYLHREAPPNATDLYATGDRRRNRNLNVDFDENVKTNGTNSQIIRENYVIRSSDVIEDWVNPNFRMESNSASESERGRGEIDGMRRLSESSSLIFRRNSTKTDQNGSADSDKRAIYRNVEFQDSVMTRESKNGTLADSSLSNNRTFVRLPTISPNKTERNKFEDYFEVVNVD